jgi:phage terminase large subunit
LAEKARRVKLRQETELRRTKLLADESASSEEEGPPVPRDVPSLVLDRNHPISDLYYKKARWKIYWGGRGSVKSWGSAEAIIRLSAAVPLRVLCVREYMATIKDSSYKLLKNTITRLGLDAWFDVGAGTITSRVGSEIIFKGLHNNEQGIRSTEDVDICVIEEAQSVSQASLVSLEPTIRKKGSEIWALYNLMEESDPIHQLMLQLLADPVANDAIIHNINYDQNPFFEDTELYGQMMRMKRADPDLYEHVWLGKPRKRSSAIILSGKYVVEDFPDDLWRKATRLLFGADFGFADDPSTLVRFFMLEADTIGGQPVYDLYIEYEAYGHHVELLDMPAFYAGGNSITTPNLEFSGVPGSRDWPIKADSARPETISHIKGQAFAISAAEKWPGSVEDGIAHLRGFRRIVIHPRCTKAAEEAYLWRYKVDQKQLDENGQPMVLPIVVDKYNHIWDAVRYGLDGYIQRSGAMGVWNRIGRADGPVMPTQTTSAWAKLAHVAQQ